MVDLINLPTYVQHLSYTGIFILFIVSEFIIGSPLPEEALLLSIGYASAVGVINPFIAAAVAFFILSGADNTFYILARSGSKYAKHIRKKANSKTLKRIKFQMKKNMPKTVFTLTFVPRLRFFGPVLAGILKLRWKSFFFVDTSALLIYVSIYVSLGFFFYNRLSALFAELEALHYIIFFVFIILFIILLGFVLRKILKLKT